jgi:hypothetical protein
MRSITNYFYLLVISLVYSGGSKGYKLPKELSHENNF